MSAISRYSMSEISSETSIVDDDIHTLRGIKIYIHTILPKILCRFVVSPIS